LMTSGSCGDLAILCFRFACPIYTHIRTCSAKPSEVRV